MNDNIQGHNSAHGERAHKGHKGYGTANLYPKYDFVNITVGAAAGNYDSATAIPANAVVKGVIINVTSAYDGAATLAIGDTATVDLFATTAQTNLLATGIDDLVQSTPSPTGNVARATLGGAPTTGAATVQVVYDVP